MENNCNALKEMESIEESLVGEDHVHMLLAGRLILLLPGAESDCECRNISHIAHMLTASEYLVYRIYAQCCDHDPLTHSSTDAKRLQVQDARARATRIPGLVGPHQFPTLMTGLNAPRFVTSVGELLHRRPMQRASVGGVPGHMVFHGNDLPHRTPRLNRTGQLLSGSASHSLILGPFPQQTRLKAKTRGGTRRGIVAARMESTALLVTWRPYSRT